MFVLYVIPVKFKTATIMDINLYKNLDYRRINNRYIILIEVINLDISSNFC